MESDTFEALFPESWLHERPRVTDRKGNPTFRVSRAAALRFPYVEPNVTGIIQSLVITDRDKPDADRIAGALGLPLPSWVAINPETTTGHIVYALKDPVPLTDAARRPPVNLLARIEHGLATVLDGDPGYTGGLTKNPVHPWHPTLWGPQEARYGLRELASALDGLRALPGPGKPRERVRRSAVGRNVALFDDTRQWSYRAIRSHWGETAAAWERIVRSHAWELNETRIANDFTTGPLTYPEVTYLAHSIAAWTWARFTPEKFTQHQRDAGRKGGAVHASNQRRRTLALIEEASRG